MTKTGSTTMTAEFKWHGWRLCQ